jgi:4-hydroxy-tetrahydrodipicolinate synthase
MGNLIDNCIENGASAIVALGTTGEGVSVSKKERENIIKYCKDKINGRAKLIVGTGNNNFKTCHENTLMAKELGADGALVVSPYYNKTTQKGLVEYYHQLSKIGIPLILYNVPSRTGLNIELETVNEIIKTNPEVYGIKESTADIGRIIKLCNICKDQISVYSGEDALNYIFYCLGANGSISVTANALAKDVAYVFEMCKENNYHLALQKQNELEDLNGALFCETNPIPVKRLLYSMGLIASPEVRLPLVELSKKNQEKIDSLASELNKKFHIKL